VHAQGAIALRDTLNALALIRDQTLSPARLLSLPTRNSLLSALLQRVRACGTAALARVTARVVVGVRHLCDACPPQTLCSGLVKMSAIGCIGPCSADYDDIVACLGTLTRTAKVRACAAGACTTRGATMGVTPRGGGCVQIVVTGGAISAMAPFYTDDHRAALGVAEAAIAAARPMAGMCVRDCGGVCTVVCIRVFVRCVRCDCVCL
jgi:hypothetical protein